MRSETAAHQIALLAASGGSKGRRSMAAEVINLLGAVTPYAAASLFAWRAREAPRATGERWRDRETLEHLRSELDRRCPSYQLMHPTPLWPLRRRGTPSDSRWTYVEETGVPPAGDREGMTTRLVTADGRYTGALHLNFDSARHPTDAARDTFTWLQPILASLFDELQALAAFARRSPRRRTPWRCRRRVSSLSCPASTPGSTWPQARRWLASRSNWSGASGGIGRSFYWSDTTGGWHRVRLLRCHGAVLLCEREAMPPYRLTPRELEVLTLVATGRSNREIADRLVLSVGTVNTHVEHLLAKLDAQTRAACAARAATEGLVCQPLASGLPRQAPNRSRSGKGTRGSG